jgi:hypothetical protein
MCSEWRARACPSVVCVALVWVVMYIFALCFTRWHSFKDVDSGVFVCMFQQSPHLSGLNFHVHSECDFVFPILLCVVF